MSSTRTRNLSCRVHPLAVATILDAYVRRSEGNEKSIGTLMGYIEGNCVVISDAFTVLHKENEETGAIALDKEYHRKMVALKKKSTPSEVVVGWFATSDDIEATFVIVHNFYSTPSESRFIPTPLLPTPVLLTIDPSLSNGTLNIRVSVMTPTVGADSLVQFHEISVEQKSTNPSHEERMVQALLTSVAKESKILSSFHSTTLVDDLNEIERYGNASIVDDNSADIAAQVSMAAQEWKNSVSATGDKAVEEMKELANTHKTLAERINQVVNANTTEIVI
jgi:hypothetical protein